MAKPFWVEPLTELLERFPDEYEGDAEQETTAFAEGVSQIFTHGLETGLAPRGTRQEHLACVQTTITYKANKRFKTYRVAGLRPFIGPGESAPVFVEHTVDRRFPDEP